MWCFQDIDAPGKAYQQRAIERQLNLTKPPGSLGRLENLAIQFCGFQWVDNPRLDHVAINVFAGDHGVCAQNVSAFPQEVTGQMLLNYARGGAAINVLAEAINAELSVVNMGLAIPIHLPSSIISCPIGLGTLDFTHGPAMSVENCHAAMEVGRERAFAGQPQLHIGGEMGIGNSSSAAAIYGLLLSCDAKDVTGPGTGVTADHWTAKCRTVERGIHRHRHLADDPLLVLAAVGGFEIAALVGFYLTSAQRGIPVLVDGFIASAAALVAKRLNPHCADWFLFSHRSAEPGHQRVLDEFNAKPILDLGMCLGEGSGAATAVPIIRLALQLHNHMATFEQAGVSHA